MCTWASEAVGHEGSVVPGIPGVVCRLHEGRQDSAVSVDTGEKRLAKEAKCLQRV